MIYNLPASTMLTCNAFSKKLFKAVCHDDKSQLTECLCHCATVPLCHCGTLFGENLYCLSESLQLGKLSRYRASGFWPQGPGFEFCLCQLFWKWHWVVTPVVASLYQGIKLGPGLGLEIQSWLWGSLCASKSRQWWIHLGFKTHGQSQPKSEIESTSGSTKIVTCHHNKFKIRNKKKIS